MRLRARNCSQFFFVQHDLCLPNDTIAISLSCEVSPEIRAQSFPAQRCVVQMVQTDDLKRDTDYNLNKKTILLFH